jgi:hypothetical protein
MYARKQRLLLCGPLFSLLRTAPVHGLQQVFPVTDLVQGGMRELEAAWGLEQEDNAGAEAELSHLLTRSEVHRLRKHLPHLNNWNKISAKFYLKCLTLNWL